MLRDTSTSTARSRADAGGSTHRRSTAVTSSSSARSAPLQARRAGTSRAPA
jgi:hypothetical protein